MNSYYRLRAWVYWVLLEKEPDDDRLMMALDIERVLDVVEAAKRLKVRQPSEIKLGEFLVDGWPDLIIALNDLKREKLERRE